MKNKLRLLFLFLFSGIALYAQPYGNEWINYTQVYYKIKVPASGIYRINYATLNSNIPDLSSKNVDYFTLYRNGHKVPIYVSGTGSFTATDFIEFYGEKNDGILDTVLYKQKNDQLHQDYSLFNDTSVYFLTYETGVHPRIANVNNDLTSLPAAESYVWYTAKTILSGNFTEGKGTDYGSGSSAATYYDSYFDVGEGWIGSDITSSSNLTLNTPGPFLSAGINAQVSAVVFGKSKNAHRTVIQLNSTTLKDTTYTGYGIVRLNTNVASNTLSSSNTFSFFAAAAGVVDRIAVAKMQIHYPHVMDFGANSKFKFEVDASPNKKYLAITNFDNRGTTPVVYDLTNNLRIVGNISGATLEIALPASANVRSLYLRSDDASDYYTVSSMTEKVFKDFANPINQGNYLIISNNKLFNDGSGNNWVEAYRQMRDVSNPTTGEYITQTVEIEELYDQFGYGCRKSPIGIKNFIRFAYHNFTITPQYAFIIGKGREYNDIRNSASAYNQCYVPTFGNPGSDFLLASEYNSMTPLVPIGRLSTTNASEVKIYLDKMVQYITEQKHSGDPYQTPDNKQWQKQVIHLGGGITLGEINTMRTYLNNYKTIVEDTFYGAKVYSVFKTSTAPIEVATSEYLRNRIDSGVSLITFFGHSAPGTFDVSLDDPEGYTNYGKYPVLISNGCFAGYIFNPTPYLSERFVLAPNKGSIAFLATTGLSLTAGLDAFTGRVYKNFCRSHYNESLGDAIKASLADIESTSAGIDYISFTAKEFILHGDPALKFNTYPKPDYQIAPEQVFFTPSVVDASMDSFTINLIVNNLGKAIDTSIAVQVSRRLPDGTDYLYRKIFKAPYYQDTLSIKMPVIQSSAGLGLNQFSVWVESDEAISEMSETNNYFTNGISLLIQSEDVLPIYPNEFAIVPQQDLLLKASTVNPFAAAQWYVFEIDTTELFNSPTKLSNKIFSSGGVVSWMPPVVFTDSTVYYWRVSKDSTAATSSYNWHNSSFIYLADEYPGWNQSHYFQWLYDDYQNIYLDTDRKFKYVNDIKDIGVHNGLWEGYGGPLAWETIEYTINNSNYSKARQMGCGGSYGLNFAIIDSLTGLPWSHSVNPGSNYESRFGAVHCNVHSFDYQSFTFVTTGTHPVLGIPWSQVIRNFIDSIPNGAYVLVYSQNNPRYTSWDATLRGAILGLGATDVLSLINGTYNGPWMFFTKKGNPSYPNEEEYRTSWSDIIDVHFTITGSWSEGNFKSTLIGPASEWGSLHWKEHSIDASAGDNEAVEVYGVNTGGVENLLFTTTNTDTFLNTIDASTYPYLRLKYVTDDYTFRTPSQQNYWRVLYKTAPEAALNPNIHFVFEGDTLGLGSDLNMELGVESINEIDMDSMLVKYVFTDAQGNQSIYYKREDSLRGLDSTIYYYRQNLNNSSELGINHLLVEINPDDDQIEQYHFNNYAQLNLYVDGDHINPLLDVTFDGVHILNGDIVSPTPEILISLKDENEYLALDDTALVRLQVKYPDGGIHYYAYDNDIMTFLPADAAHLNKENVAKVLFKPNFEQDGIYELSVTDNDRSGNSSALTKYRISFEVIHASTITSVLNYPNPFTSSTRFLFTLTGSQVPDIFKIQILSPSGKLIKEIHKEELGNIHIGRNLTDYAWDGTDTYGDAVGNGVYFYRVVTSINGESIDHKSESIDKYFKKGFGKMVLIR